MPPAVVIVIPTLNGGALLEACLASLAQQNEMDFEVIVVNNGSSTITRFQQPFPVKIHNSPSNLGFAAAINLGASLSRAPFVAALNDDTEPAPQWLSELRREIDSADDIGMCASRVLLYGSQTLDSAGMLIASDGSSKQRGQGRPASEFDSSTEVLFPSASAALYRREALEDAGWFDPDFFLYCEDTDLGLRIRRLGWSCVYAPSAIVEHHYSQTSGSASPLKVFQIERNRLWVALKNFPLSALVTVPFNTALRYFWHAWYLRKGQGTAARFGDGSPATLQLAGIVIRAHLATLTSLPRLLRQRREIRRSARLTGHQFRRLLRQHSISPREIARL